MQDRLDTHASELIPLLSGPRGLVYICGIAGMELAIIQKLAKAMAPADLCGYIQAEAEVANRIDEWERRMLHKQVKLTRRVFVEVY